MDGLSPDHPYFLTVLYSYLHSIYIVLGLIMI